MSQTEYIVSFRVTHPTRTSESIINHFGLPPSFSHSVGELRKTPKGLLLDGNYEETYCCFRLLPKLEGDFSIGIMKILPILSPHKEYLKLFVDEGGIAELFISVFTEGATGFTLNPQKMAELTSLSLCLSVEIHI